MNPFKFFIFLFFLLFFANNVFALGVSPAKVYLDFEPNLETYFQMRVSNTPTPVERDVEIYFSNFLVDDEVEDEFGNIIIVPNRVVHFEEGEKSKSFRVYLKFPEGFSKGGVHELRVGASPYVASVGGVAIKAGNQIRVFVNVSDEYVDEKYKVVKMVDILGIRSGMIKSGDEVDIEVIVKSLSDVKLDNVYAVVNVTKDGKVLRSLESDSVSINPDEEKSLIVSYRDKGSEEGFLGVEAEVFYEGGSVREGGVLTVESDVEKVNKGIEIVVSEEKFSWWWIIILIIVVLLLIVGLLYYLVRKKERKRKK